MYGRPLCKMHCKITPQRPRQGLLQYLSGSMCSPAAAETKWCSVEFWPGCVNLALDSVRELWELEHKCTKCNGAVWKDSLSDETYQDQGCWCSLDVNGKLFCDYRACRIKWNLLNMKVFGITKWTFMLLQNHQNIWQMPNKTLWPLPRECHIIRHFLYFLISRMIWITQSSSVETSLFLANFVIPSRCICKSLLITSHEDWVAGR